MNAPTEIFSDDAIVLHVVSVSEMDNRCYLLSERASGAQLLIDAADDADALRSMLASGSCEAGPLTVLTTHSHWDHTRALPAFRAATSLAGEADIEQIEAQRGVCISRGLKHGDTVKVGEQELSVIGLRGHTPGSVALYLKRPEAAFLWSGDSLFPGGVGATQGDPERFASLIDDVEHRVFKVLDDDVVVLPGHGEPTTLGAERPHLSEWRARGW